MKILLVSDSVGYSTFDVFSGYCSGFHELGIPFSTANLVELLEMHSMDLALSIILAKGLIKENNFSHVLFVAGTMIPRWVIETFHVHGIKTGMIATDDPHSSKMLLANKDVLDYYFTNEKNMEDEANGIYYVPTAAATYQFNVDYQRKNPEYQSDVCFIGSVYPNRIKPLENMLRWCIQRKKKAKLIGPIQGRTTYGELFVPEKSIIHKYGKHALVDNEDTLRFYANSKVVLNMERTTGWSPAFLKGNPHNIDIDPYSCNPRAYEVATTKTIQLYVDPRQGVIDTYGDNIYTCNTDTVGAALTEIFSTDSKILKRKTKKCYNIVKNYHTYTCRANRIMYILIRR
jgi:hypothetical protein